MASRRNDAGILGNDLLNQLHDAAPPTLLKHDVNRVHEGGRCVSDSRGATAGFEEGKVVLGVPDANHVVRRQLDLREGNLQASCLIDARRKHHDGTLVEYDLIFKTKLSDGLQHSRFMRTPCCNDAFADRERLHLFFLQGSDEIGRSLITDKVLTLGAWIVDHSSVLRDNAGEQVEVGVSESAQFASGHQDRSPSRLLQALERVVS